MKPIRVLIVDDHDLFRAGIRALLEKVPGVQVVGEAGNGLDALKAASVHVPDVVLMDILMPELNGLDATARMSARCPPPRVIMLSMNTAEEYVLESLRAGASGYLLKNVSPAELERVIKTVMRGEMSFSSAIPQAAIGKYLARTGGGPSQQRLTSRQREVLQLVAEGYKTKEIAKKLAISVKTVELHRSQLMKTLDIHDIPGLVRYAIRTGLVSADH